MTGPPTTHQQLGLTGDILVWNPELRRAFELWSMGIRVDQNPLLRQFQIRGYLERRQLLWYQTLLQRGMPHPVGGGIGQPRLRLYFLRQTHFGKNPSSRSPEAMMAICRRHHIPRL